MRPAVAAGIGLGCLSLIGFGYGLWRQDAHPLLVVAVVLVHVVGLGLVLATAGHAYWSEDLRRMVSPRAAVGGFSATLIILAVMSFPLLAWVEGRTGVFSIAGELLIRGAFALAGLVFAVLAASVFFPRAWGLKAGVFGAIASALAAVFFLLGAWNGGRGLGG